MDTKNYEYYTARDFAQDESFQQWVLCPDIKNNSFWETLIEEHPERKAAITGAISLVRSVQFRSYNLTDEEKDRIWDGVWDKMHIEEEGGVSLPVIPTRQAGWRTVWKYAAAVLIIGMVVFSVWRTTENHPEKTVSFNAETKSGEVEKVWLPDSSEVILNANSELVYSENNIIREVWLKGEAYFHVKHTKDVKAFLVHTYDDLSVKVLGTRFNVNTFGKRISVVLENGSIQLGISDSTKNETRLFLHPGEMIEYNKQTGDYSKSRIETNRIISWTTGRLIMEDYTLKDMRAFVQNVFKKELVISDSDLLREGISGSMPIVYNLDTMLVQFGKAFQLRFHQKGDEVWVQK